MILIGSTARNSGKTTLASSIISKYKLIRPVIGLKVTTIHDKNKKCIHGGEGCGVCSSLKGNFQITEELDASNNKDTSLLLTAGADKVYWLKTLEGSIYEGFQAFITRIPENALIVCESNSLRTVVNPGAFIMIKNSRNCQMKKSASEVIDQADIIMENNFNDDFQETMEEIDSIMKK
jgi:predicted P-loop ATPase/GTPase